MIFFLFIGVIDYASINQKILQIKHYLQGETVNCQIKSQKCYTPNYYFCKKWVETDRKSPFDVETVSTQLDLNVSNDFIINLVIISVHIHRRKNLKEILCSCAI